MVLTLVVASFDIEILARLSVRCIYIMKWQCDQHDVCGATESAQQVMHQELRRRLQTKGVLVYNIRVQSQIDRERSQDLQRFTGQSCQDP